MAKRKTTQPVDVDEIILTTKQLLQRVPFSRQTLWRMCRDKQFPQPIYLTTSRLGWRWSRVRAWLDEREKRPLARRQYFGTDQKSA